MTLHFGLIGAGRIGRVHAHTLSLLPNVKLIAIASSSPQAANALALDVGARAVSVDGLLEERALDAIVIASPTDTHAAFATSALKAGKAVFCEKPLDLDLARAAAVVRVAQETGRPLFVGFNRRFDPQFTALKAALDAGQVGKVEQLTIISRDPAPPPLRYIQASGGLFRDMMIHDIDMARFLLGAEPVSVQVQASVLVDKAIGQGGDVDTATALLTTAGGQQVQIINSRRAIYGYDQRVEAFGSGGLLQLGNCRINALRYFTASGTQASSLEPFFMERYAKSFVLELRAFAEAVEREQPMPVCGLDGLAALFVAEQANLSWRSGSVLSFDLQSALSELMG